jgi:hypothetical protein
MMQLRYMPIRMLSFLLLVPFLSSDGCTQMIRSRVPNGKLYIHFDYEKQPGPGSNQWAVWIEDSEGAIVKTLFVTRFTADGGYIPRPSCTPLWVAKAHPGDWSQEAIDAISGATPSSGLQSYTWDLTDTNGNSVGAGNYVLMIEATLYGESVVIYKKPFMLGLKEWSLHSEPIYSSDDETHRNMIRSVVVKYLLNNAKKR